jgi:hypothetical protein
MKGLERKKELILQRELAFSNAVGAAVFEKPIGCRSTKTVA